MTVKVISLNLHFLLWKRKTKPGTDRDDEERGADDPEWLVNDITVDEKRDTDNERDEYAPEYSAGIKLAPIETY